MDFSLQETSAAASAIRALQIQLKELRAQNTKLQQELSESSSNNFTSRDSFDKKLDLLKTEFFNKESSMKQDIIYLCERVKQLEQENSSLSSENNSLKQELLENKQNQRMIIMLQEELQIMSKKLIQKEAEHELLGRRIGQLEEQGLRNSKTFESFSGNAEIGAKVVGGHFEDKAELIDSELSQQKFVYREYLKNPNPTSQEWKSKVEQLRKSIEGNSHELLKLRKGQHEQLRTQLEND